MSAEPAIESIPQGAVLLHVGMPKTGTSALQHAAARSRKAFLANGALYPGRHHNHSWASFAVARRRRGWASGPGKAPVPPISHWTDLVAEVQAAPDRRVLVSHEYLAEHPVPVCERVVNDLDRDVHVVFTLRNQAALLSSTWQQYLKNGMTLTYEEWLRTVLVDPDVETYRSFHKRTALADLVEKWAGVVGSDKVSVVVLDKDQPEILFDSFEGLLDLPHGLLAGVELGGKQSNRSMSAAEAEYVRQMNFDLRGREEVDWTNFRSLYRLGAVARMLENRSPAPDEARIVPPRWAAELVSERAAEHAGRIAGLGVRVIGSLDQLSGMTRVAEGDVPLPASVPIEAATEASLGLFWRALREIEEARTVEELALAVSTPEGGSLGAQVRTGLARTQGIRTKDLALAVVGRIVGRARRIFRRKRR